MTTPATVAQARRERFAKASPTTISTVGPGINSIMTLAATNANHTSKVIEVTPERSMNTVA
jgi:hypothetical protein